MSQQGDIYLTFIESPQYQCFLTVSKFFFHDKLLFFFGKAGDGTTVYNIYNTTDNMNEA